MKTFLFKILLFIILLFIIFETSLRVLKITNDVPRRKIDPKGLQTFKNGQSGLYNKNRWVVNDYGFLGSMPVPKSEKKILVIGDSMIESIMNSNLCHLDAILNNKFKNELNFFEIGRSGMTLIESLEFSIKFHPIIGADYSVIYVNKTDVEESISNIKRYKDRLQINVENGKLEKVNIRYEKMKYILYNVKSLYYLYVRGFFPQKKLFENPKFSKNPEDYLNLSKKYDDLIDDFFLVLKSKYDLKKIIFLIDTNHEIDLDRFKKLNSNLITFSSDSSWFNNVDNHWNCNGNEQISSIIYNFFISKEYN